MEVLGVLDADEIHHLVVRLVDSRLVGPISRVVVSNQASFNAQDEAFGVGDLKRQSVVFLAFGEENLAEIHRDGKRGFCILFFPSSTTECTIFLSNKSIGLVFGSSDLELLDGPLNGGLVSLRGGEGVYVGNGAVEIDVGSVVP